jgi:hypothetical protein
MTEVTLEDTVVQNEAILSASTGTEIVAIDEYSGNCFTMSGSGKLIWEFTKQPLRVRDISSRLQQHYKVDEPTCAAETLGYVETLLTEKLLWVIPRVKG